ncbi:MAG: arginine--tRNA ligase [Candidatus Moraniibacteriota bacterium]|nr:MAG: arginine--tRNA ligase [Candidatus Moranbacteria bacterium]
MKSLIREIVADALKAVHFLSPKENIDFDVLYPPKIEMGDYSVNVSMILASRLKRNPFDIAKDLAEEIQKDSRVEKVDVILPGYINIFLTEKVFFEGITSIVQEGNPFGLIAKKKPERILVEFVSSNPTGPIHLGNARGGPVGDTIARVLEKLGHSVWREFYVNDFGKQIEILGHSVLKDENTQYRGDYIDDLAKIKPENINTPREVGIWAGHHILETLIEPTCKKLGISFDTFFLESSLYAKGKIEDILKLLQEQNLTYEKDGALWYRSTLFGDDKDRVILRTDTSVTYRLADFAYHKDKFDRNFSQLVTVLGADHLSEAKEMKAYIENILQKKNTYTYVITQFVRIMKDGVEVKMSKRRGTYYAMDDLIEEVGRDAVRFIFLSYSSGSHISFDINIAREQSEKNPVYYVQYAHARISGILRKADEHKKSVEESFSKNIFIHTKERELALAIFRFYDVFDTVADTYEVHRLPQYARELADSFHSFYAVCRVINEKDKERTRIRLELSEATKILLASTLDLCGVSAPEKM